MFNSRHLRVWSWQRRTPTVAGDWQARAVVTSTASPLSSSWPMPRRPRRPPPPRPSSPLPKLKYKSWKVKTITYNWHRLGWKSCKCQITSNQKSYLLAGWHLEFLGEGQLKKPCICLPRSLFSVFDRFIIQSECELYSNEWTGLIYH